MPDDYWTKMLSEEVDAMLELSNEAENFVYDEIFPQLVELAPPDERLLFYNSIDLDALKQEAPHLWEKYTGDALRIEGRAQAQAQPPPSPLTMAGIGMPPAGASPQLVAGQQALQELHKNEFMNERNNFKPQVMNPKPFGLRPADELNAGLNSGSVPMGRFGGV